MRIVSWNLGHKTKPRLVPRLGRVVAALRSSLEQLRWQILRPPRLQWSYQGGKTRTRIDHALAWQVLPRPSAEYVIDVNGLALAGRSGAISDHATLVVDFPMLMPG